MKKFFKQAQKAVSLLLAASVLCCAFLLSACGDKDGNFPLTVGTVKLEKAPENVVALNANAADIMLNLGYAGSLIGKSDDCTQSAIDFIPSFGSASEPDADAIIAAGADTVLTDETLTEECRQKLSEAGINVFRLNAPKTEAEIEALYRTLGLILGGKIKGAENARLEYEGLYSNLSIAAAEVLGASSSYTICYVYSDEAGNLVLPDKDSFIDKILTSTGSTTVSAANIEEGSTVEQTVAKYNPSFIFYSSPEVMEKLSYEGELYAVMHNQCFEMSYDTMNLMGISASQNVARIVDYMYPRSTAPVPETTESSPAVTESEPAETEPSSEGETRTVTDISAEYGITLAEDTVIDANSDAALITAVQKRLLDLGYYSGTPDGDFGTFTVQCLKNFQLFNNLAADGTADYATLSVLFSDGASAQ